MIMPEVLIDLVEEFFTKYESMSVFNWEEILGDAENETADRRTSK